MDKIMAILVEEADYARELASFLSAREDFLYKPVAFTDAAAYLKFEQENSVDLLLCDRSLEPGERPECPGKVCILTEYSTVGEDTGGRSSVFKYQSSEKLLQDIMSCLDPGVKCRAKRPMSTGAAERAGEGTPGADPAARGFRLIGVCSPIGGSRCSTFSLALADYLSKKCKTLFVTLDPFFAIPGRKNAGTRDITELLYFIESGGAGAEHGLGDYVIPDSGADIICGPSHWLDLENTGKDSLVRLARMIESSGYECAVFDLGRPITAAMELLRECTDILVTRGKAKRDGDAVAEWKRQLCLSGLSDIAERLKERYVPGDRSLEGALDRDLLRQGTMTAYIRETEEFGYNG